MKILIVDDEELALTRLKRLLKELGYIKITEASSSKEALEIAGKNSFDIAFLDISMPNTDGIELGYALRALDANLSIVYQTAHENYALRAFDVGAVNYILKPYDASELKNSIERVTKKEIRFLSKAGDVRYLLRPEDIFYVKADLTEVIFRSIDGFSYYPKKISEIEEALKKSSFLRIHRSYIINLNRIKEMNTVEQSRISFTFDDIDEAIESSKEGARLFRDFFKF